MNGKWFLLIALAFILLQCKKAVIEIPQKGVSFELNQYRKESIGDIMYSLDLDIPADKKEPINGRIKISFTLHSTKRPLVLDFSTDSSYVKSVSQKGKTIPYTFVNEHIVVGQEYLAEGLNEIDLEFIAGNLSLNRNDDYLYTLFVPDRASTCFPLFD